MTANYCPACNERLADPPSDGRCPQCGAQLQTPATQRGFDETQDLAGPVQTQVEGSSGGTHRELNDLVGSKLHVYQCESLLGRGGMGHVFVAKHERLQRRCALKILSRKLTSRDQEYIQRFQQEGRAAAALNHPHITIVHAIGEERGLHYLEMELMTGGTLQQLVSRDGRLPPTQATQLIAQVSHGLAAAHQEQIIHRDLKPDNVLLTADGNYMAPELFAGESPSLATDIYALGATFYMLLAGRVPYSATNLSELMKMVAQQPLPDLQSLGVSVPKVVSDCLAAMMAKDPKDRIPDAMAAYARLTDVLEQLRDLDDLIHNAFDREPHVQVLTEDEDKSRRQIVHVSLDGGRSQTVVLERAVPPEGDELLLIYSICCEADAHFYESALRLNGRMYHGGVAIREFDGKPMFCVINTYPWATVDVEEIRVSTFEVAEHADAVEHDLTGEDVH